MQAGVDPLTMDRLITWLLLATVGALRLHIVSAGDFEGCFTGSLENATSESNWFPWNTNQDCADHCSRRGYILAATRADLCLCTMVFPEKELASPVFSNASGERSPCNTSCMGSLEQAHCEGDECCGGTMDDGSHAYSVYAVGGLDVVTQIRRRIQSALLDNRVNWLTQGERLVKGCSSEYSPLQAPGGDYIKLDLPLGDYKSFRNVSLVEACMDKCSGMDDCRSITFFKAAKICTVNYKSSEQGKTVPSESPTLVYDRICNYTIELLSNHFELEMVTFRRLLSRGLPTSRQPLYNEDFELDLTDSSASDTVKRNIQVNNAEQYQLSTESGFQESERQEDMEQERHDESVHQGNHNHAVKPTLSTPSNKPKGFSLSAALTANNAFATFGMGNQVSTSVATGLTHEMSRAFTGWRSRATSRASSSTISKARGRTSSKTHSNFFNNGYHKTLREDKTQSYEFTMTVPPQHRGHISFFVAEAPNVLKWKASFMLNGHVLLLNKGHEQSVHVSRLLRSKDRLFYAMGTVLYNRRTIIGKTVITDRLGKRVKSEEQKLPANKIKDTKG